MDAFFASVEQRDRAELRGLPVAVGGSGRRGVVAAASYEARKFGVRSAMSSVVAQRRCPALVFVKPRFEVYKAISKQVRDIFFEYTDLIEPLSLDEAYLDVTENKKGLKSAMNIALQIRRRISEELQLTASAGVSFNKFLAKTASDINKPDGMKVIFPEEADAFLEALLVQKFHGIGKVTAKRMHRMGIFTGKDLKKFSEVELVQFFGKVGRFYFKIVRGKDDRPVNPNRIRKSISAERTFENDLQLLSEMENKIRYMSGLVFDYMSKHNNFGRTVTLKARTPDFQTITRSRTFPAELREKELLESAALKLLRENIEQLGAVRLLGVGVSNLEKEHLGPGLQLEFDFGESE